MYINNSIKHNYSPFKIFLVILLIVFSGHPLVIFSPMVREYFQVITIFMLLVSALVYSRQHVMRKFALWIIPILFLMSYHFLFLSGVEPGTNIFILMKWFIGISILRCVGQDFDQLYVDIMSALALFSLVYFVYIQFFGFLPGIPYLANTDNVLLSGRSSILLYTQIPDEFDRNYGMFWEPGAYQGFLNLALLFLIRFEKSRKTMIQTLILVATIITTKSTTGYIVLAFMLYFLVKKYSSKSNVTKYFFLILLLLGTVFVYNNTDFMGAKIANKMSDYDDGSGRITDYKKYWNMLIAHPLTGNSFNSGVISGNGFFYLLVSTGILGLGYYLLTVYWNIKKQSSDSYALWFLICLVLLFQGEVFITHPLWMGLPLLCLSKNSYISR